MSQRVNWLLSTLLLLPALMPAAHASRLNAADISSFCNQTIMSGQESVIEKRYLLNPETLPEGYFDNFGFTTLHDVWQGMSVPNQKIRMAAFKGRIDGEVKRLLGQYNFDKPTDLDFDKKLDFFKRILIEPKAPASLVLNSGTLAPVTFDFLKGQKIESGEVRSDIADASLESIAACGYYGSPSKAAACAKTLEAIVDFMKPEPAWVDFQGSRYFVSAWPLLREILNSQEYEAGLQAVALTLLEKLDSIRSGKTMDLGHFFDDVQQAFLAQGQNPARALEMTWNTIGLLATRGANIDPFVSFITPARYKLYFALTILSSVPLILDGEAITLGNLYSLPSAVRTSCNYAKSYHFWLTAFFARKFGGEVASYISEIGYQMRSTTTGRDPKRAFMIDSDDPANNKIRLDLAFAAAGAAYGTREGSNSSSMDLDQVIAALFNARGNPTPYSETKAFWLVQNFGMPAFLRWNRIFHPLAALDVLK